MVLLCLNPGVLNPGPMGQIQLPSPHHVILPMGLPMGLKVWQWGSDGTTPVATWDSIPVPKASGSGARRRHRGAQFWHGGPIQSVKPKGGAVLPHEPNGLLGSGGQHIIRYMKHLLRYTCTYIVNPCSTSGNAATSGESLTLQTDLWQQSRCKMILQIWL